MEISVALYKRVRSYFELCLEDLAVSQIQGIPVEPEVKTEIAEILQELRHLASDVDLNADLTEGLRGSSNEFSQETKDFGQRLFETWRSLAVEEIGENFWSYPITIAVLAEEMSMSNEKFIQYLDTSNLSTSLPNLQVLKNRMLNSQALTFHPLTFHPLRDSAQEDAVKEISTSQKAKKKSTSFPQGTTQQTKFNVGDRVRVNQQRPQYANHTGTVTQVISVSCRISLDNGWSAFLPHHCLEKI
jgi:hypothetical protein